MYIDYDGPNDSWLEKILKINWILMIIITIITLIGVTMLYSAARGSFHPWAVKHFVRYISFIPITIIIAISPARLWFKYSYAIYIFGVVCLIAVELFGKTSMGATRWIGFLGLKLQPSEIIKVGMILALARYFHSISSSKTNYLISLIIPAIIIALPIILIVKQPDLGTAIILLMLSISILFLNNISVKKFLIAGVAGLCSIPIIWNFMYDYQKKRVINFLHPETDPLGSGYNLLQSKIAIGSGGVLGKGFLDGTQSQLSFLPEKQTDFIFTTLAEEFGFIGGLVVIILYGILIFYSMLIANKSNNHFGRLVGGGVAIILFLHFFVNIAMVMGLLPVVGVPLPFVSYGGNIMLTMMIAVGLLQNVYINKHDDFLYNSNLMT